ncbi:multidrug efflux RND transporter permease subunit [Dechloromonas denitrificans]|uniref:multidrug efflux RND transporter permease subunit n=1 Tax=Dechloromonas denitrificans TaxID=281362 RepID=UPI001CF82D5F|nr:multidrug efflux RND transporter permease subunit [Dechloromonas denitrificans]UCV05587.1 multidrug efflux RND transporter permease subunit [Dechloromonas denitrificans]UCV09935.1 multidrug efflux RND transporter permease subunit [Dechloromonas denitrificans]
MSLTSRFIHRPVATTLLTLGIALLGVAAFFQLPAALLPQVEFPTISVRAALPGASPETMAATVATPLERALGSIAGVNEITSNSSQGAVDVTLQFDLSRSIDGAAKDVQAAINASRAQLPSGMTGNPSLRKVNPNDSPVLVLSLTSNVLSRAQVYDAAVTILGQKLSQVEGVGQVNVGGSSLPAVRIELNPQALSRAGISPEAVRTAIANTNVNRPKGLVDDGERNWQIAANDQATRAADYIPTIISWKDGAAIRLGDIAEVRDGAQDIRNAGLTNGKPSVLLMVSRQPGANIIATVDRVRAMLPLLQAAIHQDIKLEVAQDRSATIRASLRDVGTSLAISVGLVVMVVMLFLRNRRAALVPAVAVPVSLIGTLSVMYLAGFSLNNLSLMALTVATGFVVDDAVVVLENITRHIEKGLSPLDAALKGVREVAFTVVSMTLSLIAAFIPILFMGGIVGRLFREFAVTLAAAILVSLVVSLATTPMMCSRLLRPHDAGGEGWLSRLASRCIDALHAGYRRSLAWSLDHGLLMMAVLASAVALNVYLYNIVPKGFFPQQDTGRLSGNVQADQSSSFQSMQEKLADFIDIVRKDPAVANVAGFTGGGRRNSAQLYISLKPLSKRGVSAEQVIERLRRPLSQVAGASLFLQSVQEIRIGGRQSNSQYQYTLLSDDLEGLRAWEPRIRKALADLPELADVNTDRQDKGLQTSLVVDRELAARLGLTQRNIDTVLNDFFGQRLISTIYNPLNQYRVVMEAAPRYWQSPEALSDIILITPTGSQVPLSAIARWQQTFAPLAIAHQSQFAASTISFALPPGVSLGDATQAINETMARLGVPNSIYGSFEGSAKAFQASMASQPILILGAVIAVYLVLGILYESLIHPLTILSTLPSAGIGALLALLAFKTEFSVIALIGVILLIGIVKKNAIMMVDFALQAERDGNLTPRQAIYQACLLRFRPIMMTTLAALFGAIPLALGSGDGAELRQPLGIAIVGGLIISQLLTLYTTPVVYLYLDRFRLWGRAWRARRLSTAGGTT